MTKAESPPSGDKAVRRPVRRDVRLCAVHLGDAVQYLATWAAERGLTHGQVTVLIADPAVGGYTLAFGRITLAGSALSRNSGN